jgi:Ni,Fe-hydrogenase III small subunit/NAD-dependent dihydropyrimidine dehydrogenase PreA subunit
MVKALLARLKFGNRTIGFPDKSPMLPELFRGRPVIGPELCKDGCSECVEVCPTSAIKIFEQRPQIDLGRCLFCGECEKACSSNMIKFTKDFSLAANKRIDLIVNHESERALVQKLNTENLRLFKRSLRLRQVSAGGCNGCEVEVNVLGTIVFDLGRFGIQFVASPRHADGLLITGPVTKNMRLALQKTYEAVPDPKIVIAVGACAISGGPYIDHSQAHNGAVSTVPVDLFIPGCPPHPITILDGMLRLLSRMPKERVSGQLNNRLQNE